MKKALLLLSLALSVSACKKNETKTAPIQKIVSNEEDVTLDCSIFDTLNGMSTEDQVKWLRNNQDTICKPMYDQCRENAHKITAQEFDDAISAYWGTRPVKYSYFTLEQIERLSSQKKYTQFIKATNNNEDVVLAADNNFSVEPVCYSVPLFYSIERIHNLGQTDTLAFTIGKIKDLEKIIFNIKGTSDNYDMTNFPQ